MKEISILCLPLPMHPVAEDEILRRVRSSARPGLDFIMLPETCTGAERMHEPGDLFLNGMAQLARSFHSHICCPVGMKGSAGERLNTALLFGRDGEVLGRYDKLYPYWGEFDKQPPATPGRAAKVIETDVGKVGLAICFDVNFSGMWEEMARQGAELILWPSEYSAGVSLRAHALNHHYAVVSCTRFPDCTLVDIDGHERAYHVAGPAAAFELRFDMDRVLCHRNFNADKIAKLSREHPEISVDVYEREHWLMLSGRGEASVRELAREYGIETLCDYKARSLVAIDAMRPADGR